jgi:hypothetical protein
MSKKKFFIFIAFIILLTTILIFQIEVNKADGNGWVENTEELKALQLKVKNQGYMTKEDFQELDRIHEKQLSVLREKAKK